jgi:plasmid maintenance system antidote protein VapI
MRTVQPVSPGEMLEEEFLKPLGLTKYRLAKAKIVFMPQQTEREMPADVERQRLSDL